MNVECSLNTNILVYAAAGRSVQDKRSRALEFIARAKFGPSAHVLQEFCDRHPRDRGSTIRVCDPFKG